MRRGLSVRARHPPAPKRNGPSGSGALLRRWTTFYTVATNFIIAFGVRVARQAERGVHVSPLYVLRLAPTRALDRAVDRQAHGDERAPRSRSSRPQSAAIVAALLHLAWPGHPAGGVHVGVSPIAAAVVRRGRPARRSSTACASKVSEAMQLGQYTLGRKIGEGGMGAVYRAHHALLRRPTAIKLLRPDKRRRRQPRALRARGPAHEPAHPSQHGRGLRLRPQPDGVFYYAMEYLGGGIDLERLVRKHGPQPASASSQILVQVCGALARSARPRPHPSRHQAGEHHPVRARRHARRREGGRLRPRQGDRRPTPTRRRRSILGTPGVHRARGGHRSDGDRPGRRPLRARRGRLLPAHRPARVRGQDTRRYLRPARHGDAEAAVAARRASRPARGADPALPREAAGRAPGSAAELANELRAMGPRQLG